MKTSLPKYLRENYFCSDVLAFENCESLALQILKNLDNLEKDSQVNVFGRLGRYPLVHEYLS